ncbi:MAG: hypothetical protein ACREIA_12650, partial [Opitutaceae bacterium]
IYLCAPEKSEPLRSNNVSRARTPGVSSAATKAESIRTHADSLYRSPALTEIVTPLNRTPKRANVGEYSFADAEPACTADVSRVTKHPASALSGGTNGAQVVIAAPSKSRMRTFEWGAAWLWRTNPTNAASSGMNLTTNLSCRADMIADRAHASSRKSKPKPAGPFTSRPRRHARCRRSDPWSFVLALFGSIPRGMGVSPMSEERGAKTKDHAIRPASDGSIMCMTGCDCLKTEGVR